MMKPKGQLIIIGGGEDKGDGIDMPSNNRAFEHFEILKELMPHRKDHNYHIEIITTASNVPEEIKKSYRKAFRRLGHESIGFLHLHNNEEANDPEAVKRIENANTVFFSGGDQFKLSTILGCTTVADKIEEKYQRESNFIVAGTSAGAMVMSKVMLYEGERNEAILKGSARLTSGLGFIDDCVIDTHFIKRGRFGRLAEALIMNPSCVGIGLGEDTALVIKQGNKAVCKGSGMVIIIDGKNIRHTNIAYAEEGTPVCIENLTVHILTNGCGFLLGEREFIPSPKDLRLEHNN